MKTQGLKQALDKHGFVAFGGTRRMRKKAELKSESFPSVTAVIAGTQKTNVLSFGIFITAAKHQAKVSVYSHYQTGQS